MLREKEMPPRAVPAGPLGGAADRRRAPGARAGARASLDRRIRPDADPARSRLSKRARASLSRRARTLRLGKREAAGEERAARHGGLAAELADGERGRRSTRCRPPRSRAARRAAPRPSRSRSGPASEPSRAVLVTRSRATPAAAQSLRERRRPSFPSCASSRRPRPRRRGRRSRRRAARRTGPRPRRGTRGRARQCRP